MTALTGARLMKYDINRKNLVTAPFPRIPKPKWTHFVGEELGLSKAEFSGFLWDSCRARRAPFQHSSHFPGCCLGSSKSLSASLHMVRSVLCFIQRLL